MNAQQIRDKYLAFFKAKSHRVIPRALLVPQDDPTTLFTGSGMQPLITYLLGTDHPEGTRLVDSQTCLRAQDIEEVGDNRHTTFFEMLGNWSLGDYFKQEELPWLFEFLVGQVGLDPSKLYATCFIGDEANNIPRDEEAAAIWKKLFNEQGIDAKTVALGSDADAAKVGMQSGRIFFYDDANNWWWRGKKIVNMPAGEPGGPSSEVFYEFDFVEHNPKYGEQCHPNCDCGRFMEIGNSVFMEYLKTETGFSHLPKKNVDFGGGLERISAAAINSPDVFKISLLWPIITKLETMSGKSYDSSTNSMRIIADHLRGATFLAVDGIAPSNKEQGYVMRRLIRRAIRFAFDLGIASGLCEQIVPIVTSLYKEDYPEVKARTKIVLEMLEKEEALFRKTLGSGVRELAKYKTIEGSDVFKLYDTFGFPAELTIEEAASNNVPVNGDWRQDFDKLMDQQRDRSRTASKGEFKGGLADHSEITTKYHTATHLMYRALKNVLGDSVIQRGSNITEERLRFDFSYDQKMTPEQIKQVEDIVNQQIKLDLPVSWREENAKQALAEGVAGAFGDKYPDMVKVYTVGDPDGKFFSREICGGPHVDHAGQLGEHGKEFKITKEESSSSGVRRIKAVLV